MKNLKCLFANTYSFLSTARFLNEAEGPELGRGSQVEGAGVVPLAQLDQSTKVENLPTVPLAIPESESPMVQAEGIPLAQLDQSTKIENIPGIPLVSPNSESQKTAIAAANQKKEEGNKIKSPFEVASK